MLIANIYRQPDDIIRNNRSTCKEFNEAIDELLKTIRKIHTRMPNIIITGDFNLPHTKWPEGTPSKVATADEQNMLKKLNEVADELLLTQHINKPTHRDGNTLDLLFTNNENLIHSYSTMENLPTISDHHTIEVLSNLVLSNTQKQAQEPEMEDIPPMKKLNFHSEAVNWEAIKKELSCTDWHTECRRLNPPQIVERIQQICYDISAPNVPPKKTPNKNNSTIPRDRRSLMRRRTRINKRLLRTTSSSIKDKLRKELIKIERELQKSRKNSKAYEERKAIQAIKRNAKYFYTYAKKFAKTKGNIGPLINDKEEYIYDNAGMANLLSDQYKSVYTEPDKPLPSAAEIFPDQDNSKFTDINFSEEDIIEAIKKLSESAGSGPGSFPAILLKRCQEELAIPLHIL